MLKLFSHAEVTKVLPQSEGIKHGEKVIEQVPCWDVHKVHKQWGSVCMCVCVHMCVCVCICACECVCVCACEWVCVCVCACGGVGGCVCVWVCVCMCERVCFICTARYPLPMHIGHIPGPSLTIYLLKIGKLFIN